MPQFPPAVQQMLTNFTLRLDGIQEMPPRADDEVSQLLDARQLANKLGLYDAADYIRDLNLVYPQGHDWGAMNEVFSTLPKFGQSQDATCAQALRLSIACDRLGLKKAAEHLREKHTAPLEYSA